MKRVLLCDDDPLVQRALARVLREHFEVVIADGVAALDRLAAERFDAVVTDLRMPEVDGFAVLSTVRKVAPGTPVIVMSGSAEINDAIMAMRAGARDFLIKPVDAQALEDALLGAFGGSHTPPPVPDPIAWRNRVAPWLLGESSSMLPVLTAISQIADTRCTVLITGESGTGKELVARSIVAGSPRARAPLVAVNCAAIPAGLVESDFFGHARGAFTGATTARVGRFAQADGGTIFLDEIGEMELGAQAKLLRLLQDGELCPVGEETAQRVDVRVLAATNRNLESDVAAGRFRGDLYWRLNVIPIEVPPLRDRTSDIPELCEHFIRRAAQIHGRAVTGIDGEAVRVLQRHSWPGNLRELENLVERMVILRGSGRLTIADLPPALRPFAALPPTPTPLVGPHIEVLPSGGPTDLRTTLEQIEDRMIAEALERTGGNKNRAAELLGINRTTLVEKLRRKRVFAA